MSQESWKTRVGLNNVGSYQVSGKPFATGSCLAPASGSVTLKITFPKVTKWVQIVPDSEELGNVKVGFSHAGTIGTNHFVVNTSASTSQALDLKVSELYFVATDATTFKFDILAGLTNIDAGSVETDAGPNWKGTDGVG
tara:strand:+ start:361 stop:777 length:417 start_codon:yes stop_codon:yes gene_type:complete